jgi:carbonic anhydrase
MRVRLLAVALSAAFLAPSAFAEGHAHWGYEGHGDAAHWGDLDESFKTCKLGKLQSPIDIETKKVQSAGLKDIAFAYAPKAGEVVNNGHTIQVNVADGGKITLDNVDYKLAQFHFHNPSEEKVDGKSYPLVAHLVHKSAEGKLAVVAVLFKQGAENPALKRIFAKLPAKEGEKVALDAPFDAAELLPKDRGYYAFMGSLTTPPCSEEVRWQVLKTPVDLSDAQLAAFTKLYKANARPVQPLNGRVVQSSR